MANGNNQDILSSLRELIDVLNKGVKGDSPEVKLPTGSERVDILKEIDDQLDDILEKEKELQEREKQILELQEKGNALGKKEKEILKEKLKQLKQQQLELQKQNTLVGKLQKKYEAIKNSQLAQFAGKTADAFGKLNRAMDAGINSAATLAEKFGGLEQNVLSFETAKTQAKNIDQMSVSLNRASGLSGDFSKTIVATQRELRSFGITNQKTADTIQALGTGMSDFTRMDKNTREELTKTVAKFTTLGVSIQDTANLLETGTKTLGMSSEQSIALQEELVKTARGIGIAPAQMVQGFAQAAPRLAAHGANMKKVLEGLMLQTKNTGASIEGLLGITEGFDTFEEAARKTSQLNAMFGTQLNSVDLLNATEEERIQILQDSLAATGKSIDTMGRFELKSLAQIIGVDVATVRKTFGATTEGLEDLERKASAAKSSVNIEEEMTKSVTAQQRLTAANEAFKNTIAMETIGAIRNQAETLSTNDTLMRNIADNASIMAMAYNTALNAATGLQDQLSKVAIAQAGMDFKNTMVAPLGAGLGILGSMAGLVATIGGGILNMRTAAKLGKGGGGAGAAGGSGGDSGGRGRRRSVKGRMRLGRAAVGKVKGLGKGMKLGGGALGVVGAGFDAYDRFDQGQTGTQIAAGVGSGLAGAAIGAKTGAAAGLMFGPAAPVMSPLLGLIGGGVGYFTGGALADKITGAGDSPVEPSSMEPSGLGGAALLPPKVTPQADASSAQVSALTSTIQSSLKTAKDSASLNPTFNLTAYVGGRKTASQLFVEGAKGLGVGSVSTNGTP